MESEVAPEKKIIEGHGLGSFVNPQKSISGDMGGDVIYKSEVDIKGEKMKTPETVKFDFIQ